MLQQLLPFLRLDGYYILSDLTGVPDMFSRIKPVFRSLKPGAEAQPRVAELKPWVRVVVTAYVLTVVPLLAFSTLVALIHAPRMFATAYDSLGVQYDKVSAAVGDGAVASIASGSLQLLMLALPTFGLVLTFSRVGSRAGKGAWRWSDGHAERRALVVATATAGVALAAFTWWPNGDYRPIQPGERGTIQGGLHSVDAIPSGRPSLTPHRERELGGAPTARRLEDDTRLELTPDTIGKAKRSVLKRAPRGATGRGTGRATATPTPSAAAATPSPSAAVAPGATATPEATPTPQATATPTPTPTVTATPTAAATATATPTATPVAAATP
jgi:putative peptide zinc metalloprotease protein